MIFGHSWSQFIYLIETERCSQGLGISRQKGPRLQVFVLFHIDSLEIQILKAHGARGSFILDRKSHWIPSVSCLVFPAIVSKDVEINGLSKSTEVGLLFLKKKFL